MCVRARTQFSIRRTPNRLQPKRFGGRLGRVLRRGELLFVRTLLSFKARVGDLAMLRLSARDCAVPSRLKMIENARMAPMNVSMRRSFAVAVFCCSLFA